MADVVDMPKLGFDMAEGTLIRWVKGEGDEVAKGDVLAEIETDKATVEVESYYTGFVRKLLVPEGEIVPVGTHIAIIGEENEEINIKDLIGEEQPTEKQAQAASEPLSESTGAQAVSQPTPSAEVGGNGHFPGGVKASPVARRMADEHGLDLSAISGSGPGGRIVKRDIETYLEAPPQKVEPKLPAEQTPQTHEKAAAPPPLPVFTPSGPPPEDKRIPLPRLRGAIGRRMVEAKQQAPHFYVSHEYDMGSLMELRTQINRSLEGTGEKLSVNDFIVKAVALTLRQFPNINASLEGDQILQHGQINVGIAVAVEGGLLTVVCRDADRKSLRQISSEVRVMAGRARDGKVKPEDIEGSTFSISNLGMFDVESFIAIINPPEAGILAIGSVLELPVVRDGQLAIGQRMKATISIDHRVSDGAEAARFLQGLAQYLEDPLRLML